jgi:hypothetical protein
MKIINLFTTLSCAAIIAGAIQLSLGAEPLYGQAQTSASSAASAVSSTAAAASTQGAVGGNQEWNKDFH